ncbi:MAG: type III-A CRISPR-associated protein Cas10/Csm1 [Candidatus Margulisbacteria bacterium GWF2_38_17]|nr:MAG: type III-A CRISPR-associated protein Cas10/Csm1 [Candidatus Margulisbacteria bacterium GWF2_38_17]
MDNKERNTVVLAALLHDVGKPLDYAKSMPKDKGYDYWHSYLGGIVADHLFCGVYRSEIEEYINLKDSKIETSCINKDLVDNPMLMNLIVGHHEKESGYKNELLYRIVSASDCYSAAERAQEDKENYDNDPRLVNLFADISGGDKKLRYKSGVLIKEDLAKAIMPGEDTVEKKQRVNHLLQDIQTVVSALKKELDFNILLSMLDLVLFKHLWAWPSTRRYTDVKDISLYDHLRISSALAVCMYDQKTASESKYRLIQGDFSGIQNYIYDITSINAAKRLRSRSFYVQALTENIVEYILGCYKLPGLCVFKNAGGGFQIIVPAASPIDFNEMKTRIVADIYSEFQGEINLNLCLSREFSGDELKGKNGAYRKLHNDISEQFQKEKLQPFKSLLIRNGIWHGACFVHENSKKAAKCKGCGKPRELLKEDLCDICEKDVARGKQLVNCNYIAYKSSVHQVIPEFNLVERLAKRGHDNERMIAVNPDDFDKMKNLANNLCPIKIKFMANYVPSKKSINNPELIRIIEKYENAEKEDERQERDAPLHFKCLADFSDGAPMLAVFKADVDNLGSLFGKEIADDRFTVTRLATMSRMLDMFFSGYLESLVRTEFPECYFVYAGGDDLVIIGPWTIIIDLAIRINQDFQKFVGNNPKVTLSAGISIFKPKYPILKAVEMAEVQLSKAKNNNGKNSVCIFGQPLKWGTDNDELKIMMDLCDNIKAKLKNKTVSIGYIYQLLTFIRMSVGNENKDKMWKPLFHYLTARNYSADDALMKELMNWEKIIEIYKEKSIVSVNLALYSRRGNKNKEKM